MSDWKKELLKLDKQTSWPGATCTLLCDGIKVSFQNVMNGRRLSVAYYIDGKWEGTFMNLDSPIGQVFGRPMSLPKKYNLDLIKKRKGSAAYKEAKGKIVGYSWLWNSAADVIKHISKTCKSIEVYEQI